MSTITLAQLRNKIALSSYPEKYEWIDAIDAELKARGELVGCLTISRFRGYDGMVNHDFDYYGDLPDGSYTVYTAPLAPKIEVTEATLRDWFNLLCHAGIDAEEENAPRTKFRIADVAKEVSHEIARFENAALKETP